MPHPCLTPPPGLSIRKMTYFEQLTHMVLPNQANFFSRLCAHDSLHSCILKIQFYGWFPPSEYTTPVISMLYNYLRGILRPSPTVTYMWNASSGPSSKTFRRGLDASTRAAAWFHVWLSHPRTNAVHPATSVALDLVQGWVHSMHFSICWVDLNVLRASFDNRTLVSACTAVPGNGTTDRAHLEQADRWEKGQHQVPETAENGWGWAGMGGNATVFLFVFLQSCWLFWIQ